MIDLKESRKNIDEIDRQIVALFEQRMRETNEVAKYKLETGKAVYDKMREDEKLEILGGLSSNAFNRRAVIELFSQIMSISRKYQYGFLPSSDWLSDFQRWSGCRLQRLQRYVISVCRAPTHNRRWKIFLERIFVV